MTDFFDVARPKIERLAIELNEVDGLTPAEVADSLLACALSLGAGACGEARTAGVLAALSGRFAAGLKRKAEETPPGRPN